MLLIYGAQMGNLIDLFCVQMELLIIVNYWKPVKLYPTVF